MAKISKIEANYIDKSKNKHCDECKMFIRPNGCTLVVGFIYPLGHCRYWEAKGLPVAKMSHN